MSQRALTLPIRSLSTGRPASSQWVCRRCLATQSESTPSSATPPIPPLNRSQVKDPGEVSNYDPSLPASQRDYRLTTTDFFLKKALPHQVPPQYLQNTTTKLLNPHEQAQKDRLTPHKTLRGVVVQTGKMEKTVTVRIPNQKWNQRVKKFFTSYTKHLVHDPNSSLILGDVIELHRLRTSAAVHHVVAHIVSPFEKPIKDRPPVPTADERLALYKEKRFAKLHRRTLRREAAKGNGDAIQELQSMGLDPGKGVEEGRGETANLESGVGSKRTPNKGAILGRKGQKLPEGVLPGGKAEVGKINDRAQKNKGKAMRLERKAVRNLEEARQKGEVLEGELGLGSESGVPTQGKERDSSKSPNNVM